MTTFFFLWLPDFALEIEASSVKKDLKRSLETWNVNVIVYVWYIYFMIKKNKKYGM